MDIVIYSSIAIVYNLFVHNLTSIMYQDLQYDEKYSNTLIMILTFGILGMMMPKLLERYEKYNNKNVAKGLYYGGILLVLTAVVGLWSDLGNENRVFVFGLLLGVLIWWGYKRV